MSGNHVRQPRPPKYSALTLRRRLTSNLSAPPCASSCHLPPASSSMPLSIPPSVPLPMPLLRRHPFCRLAYTVLFIVHAIRIPSCKPGFKHGRPPCPRCRRILLVSLLFHHCLTPLLSFIRPHDQPYRPYKPCCAKRGEHLHAPQRCAHSPRKGQDRERICAGNETRP